MTVDQSARDPEVPEEFRNRPQSTNVDPSQEDLQRRLDLHTLLYLATIGKPAP